MRIAITGANGQIGSYLASRLTNSPGVEVVAVCRNSVGAGMVDAKCCEIRIGSLSDAVAAQQVVGDCDAVVHCALATGLPGRARRENLAMIRAIAALRRVEIFVYLSSVAVYSSCIERVVNTFESPRPDTAYGRDKLRCESAVWRAFSSAGRHCFILRLGHVYGAGTYWSRCYLEAARSANFALPFSGRLLSNAVRIDRVGEAIVGLLEGAAAPGIYNVADQPHRNWSEVFQWHTQTMGLAPVAYLRDEQSESERAEIIWAKHHRLLRVAREIGDCMHTLPLRLVAACPSIRTLGESSLAGVPVLWQERIKLRYQKAVAMADTAAIQSSSESTRGQELYFDPMPGPYLQLVPDRDDPRQRERLLAWLRPLTRTDGAWLDLLGGYSSRNGERRSEPSVRNAG